MSTKPTILFIDDEAPFRRWVGSYLEEKGYRLLYAGSAAEGLSQFDSELPSLVLLDLKLPDFSGIKVLKQMRAVSQTARVIVLTARTDAGSAVCALKAGAANYLTKPIELDRLLEAVEEAAVSTQLGPPQTTRKLYRPPRLGREEPSSLVGEDPRWLNCIERIQRSASSEIEFGTVLLLGESGTGKSLLARIFHKLASQRKGPFQEVDCPSIPEQLLESELFGHERGAFTGATSRRRGLVEMAGSGTLFLDEIGDLPLSLQPKLLRFLETRRYRRVGGESERQSEAQIVSATNMDLQELVREGKFRGDLFYRLNVISVRVPPLRERGNDVVLLARQLIEDFSSARDRAPPVLSSSAEDALLEYAFPGNVRELRNAIQRTLTFLKGDVIEAAHLHLTAHAFDPPTSEHKDSSGLPAPVDLERVLQAVEAHYIGLAIDAADKQSEAALLLGIDRFALARRRGRYSRQENTELALQRAPGWIKQLVGTLPSQLPAAELDLFVLLRDVRNRAITFALERCHDNRANAAAILGMSRSMLRRRLKESAINASGS